MQSGHGEVRFAVREPLCAVEGPFFIPLRVPGVMRCAQRRCGRWAAPAPHAPPASTERSQREAAAWAAATERDRQPDGMGVGEARCTCSTMTTLTLMKAMIQYI